MRCIGCSLALGLALANGSSGNEISVAAQSYGGPAIDFAGTATLSQITRFETEFHLLYQEPVTQSSLSSVSFSLGALQFENVPVSSFFWGHEYSNGDPVNSSFSLYTPAIHLSSEDAATLLADIEDDGLVTWTILDPPLPDSPGGPLLSTSGIWLTGLEGIPDQDGEPTHSPEPSAILIWASVLLIPIAWRENKVMPFSG